MRFTNSGSSPARLSDAEALTIARDVFLYAYPLVVMDVTRQQLTSFSQPSTSRPGAGPPNRFIHITSFPDASFKAVVRPNVDTLYSTAWLDLADEPLVLSVPATDRYFMLPLLSMWTDVFSVLGTRTLGRDAGRSFVVVGRDWNGDVPHPLPIVRAPTRYVWIIGRTQTNGRADCENVRTVQSGYTLTPLSAWGTPGYEAPPGKVDPSVDLDTPPPVQVARMDALTFYGRFADLMKDNPPYFYDDPIVRRMERLGIRVGESFALARTPATTQAALTQALREGNGKLADARDAVAHRSRRGGWIFPPTGGFYGNDHLLRALIALHGLGMNLPEDAVYAATGVDGDGAPLNGDRRYALRFAPGELPPVDAFWSITAYDPAGYLIANPIDRYAIGDRDPLVRAADGSLTIQLQSESPKRSGIQEANWLPIPAHGPFNLLLRLYGPREVVIREVWIPPPVTRVD